MNPRHFLVLFWFLFSVSLFAQQPPQQPPPQPAPAPPPIAAETFRINGQVLPAPGQTSLPTILSATLLTDRGSRLKTVTVSGGGSFEFDDVPSGQYLIRIEGNGVETLESRVEVLDAPEFVSLQFRNPSGDPVRKTVPAGSTTVSVGLASAPKEAVRELKKGEEALVKNDSPKAEKHLRKAIEIHPPLVEARNNLASILLRDGRESEALEMLETAQSFEPDNPTTARNLGVLYFTRKEYGAARSQLEKVVAADGQDFKAAQLLGETEFQLQHYPECRELYSRAVQLNPEYVEGFLRVGSCAAASGDSAGAIEAFQSFAEQAPNDPRTPKVREWIEKLRAASSKPNSDGGI